jgi:hypothetical protein
MPGCEPEFGDDAPEVPDLPELPEAPELPELPDVPGVPEFPVLPEFPVEEREDPADPDEAPVPEPEGEVFDGLAVDPEVPDPVLPAELPDPVLPAELDDAPPPLVDGAVEGDDGDVDGEEGEPEFDWPGPLGWPEPGEPPRAERPAGVVVWFSSATTPTETATRSSNEARADAEDTRRRLAAAMADVAAAAKATRWLFVPDRTDVPADPRAAFERLTDEPITARAGTTDR